MLAKLISATLLVLAAVVVTAAYAPWTSTAPVGSSATHSQTTPVKAIARVTPPPAGFPPSRVAVDDFRMHLQDGVTADSYNLVPLAEHDAARTQSMIDGIAGRRATRSAPTATDDGGNNAAATSLLPSPTTAALWLAGLMAVVLMALRRRH